MVASGQIWTENLSGFATEVTTSDLIIDSLKQKYKQEFPTVTRKELIQKIP